MRKRMRERCRKTVTTHGLRRCCSPWCLHFTKRRKGRERLVDERTLLTECPSWGIIARAMHVAQREDAYAGPRRLILRTRRLLWLSEDSLPSSLSAASSSDDFPRRIAASVSALANSASLRYWVTRGAEKPVFCIFLIRAWTCALCVAYTLSEAKEQRRAIGPPIRPDMMYASVDLVPVNTGDSANAIPMTAAMPRQSDSKW